MSSAEFRPREIAIAVLAALSIEAAAVVLLRGSLDRAGPRAAPPAREVVVPVRAVGVDDPNAPLLKLGGGSPRARSGKGPASEPRRAREAPPTEKTRDAFPTEDAEPKPDAPAEEPAAATTAQAGEAAASPEGAAPGEDGASELPPGPGGEGSPEGSPGGTETDPLKARAVDLYRARIIAWFSGRFRVSGSGLPAEELERLRVSATVSIAGDRRVTGYTITPSGSAPFDAAARAALESTVGSLIPAPPESYPDVVQSTIQLTFVCRRGQCD